MSQTVDLAIPSLLDAPPIDAVLFRGSRTLRRIEGFAERLVVQNLELGEAGFRPAPAFGNRLTLGVGQGVRVGTADAVGVEPFQSQLIGRFERRQEGIIRHDGSLPPAFDAVCRWRRPGAGGS